MNEFISKQNPCEVKMTSAKRLANKINSALYKEYGAMSCMPVICSMCANITIIDDSFSNQGRNLLCSKCVYSKFETWQKAFDDYISK